MEVETLGKGKNKFCAEGKHVKKWKGKMGKIEIILTVALLATSSLTILTFVVLPHFEIPAEIHLNSIDMLSSNEGWIVGRTLEGGIILRWDGVSWSVVENPFENAWLRSFDSIDMLSSNEGWAVGNCGIILRWDGVSWSVVESPVENAWFDSWFDSVDMLSANEGWIVGGTLEGGIILRWDGVSWSVFETPTPNFPYSVNVISSNEGWAVGGTILRWDGVSWSEIESPVENAEFYSVDMLSSDEGWIVGAIVNNDNASGREIILRWDGTRWSLFETPTYEWLLWAFTGITIAIAALLLVVLYRKRR